MAKRQWNRTAKSFQGRLRIVRARAGSEAVSVMARRSCSAVDGRSPWVRRCKDVINAHLSDLPDASVAERSIIRRAAVLTTELEQLEVKFALAGAANADDLDLSALCQQPAPVARGNWTAAPAARRAWCFAAAAVVAMVAVA
jgi:hypothetical protein